MSDSENTPERAVNGETSGVAEVRTISSPRSIEKRSKCTGLSYRLISCDASFWAEVACITEQQKVFNKVPNAEWSFAKLFGDMEHVAAAELVIPVGYRKPARNTRENIFVCSTYSPRTMIKYSSCCCAPQVFYVIRGVLRVTIHQTEMVLTEGSSFMVPQGKSARHVCELYS